MLRDDDAPLNRFDDYAVGGDDIHAAIDQHLAQRLRELRLLQFTRALTRVEQLELDEIKRGVYAR